MPSLKDVEDILNPADPSLAGLVPIGSTVAGGIINHNAIGDATNAQITGTQGGIDAVNAAGSGVNAAYQPYMQAGKGALDQLSAGIAPGGGLTDPFHYDQKDFQNDPAYQFTLGEGEKAINRGAAARGGWGNPSTVEALTKYGTGLADQTYAQDYTRAENTFNTNKQQRLQALQQLAGTGLTSTQGDVQGQEWTATQISDLLGQRADAIAAGDIDKANSITQTLSGIAGQVSGNSALKKLYDVFKGGGSTVGSDAQALSQVAWPGAGAAAGLAAPEAAAIPGLGSLAGTATGLPELAASAQEVAAPATGATTGAAGGGIGSAAIGFLTNPITIGVGAAIIGITALLKSQAHWEANTLVKDVQNPFGQKLGSVVDGFDQALASGQLDRATAQQLRDQTAAVINDFNTKVTQFAQGGSDKREAALNAMHTMAQNFGALPNGLPSYEKILGKMDQEIAQLPEAA